MVSYYNPLSMYQKNLGSNLPYSTTHGWYPNYPPSHHPNSQYLSNSAASAGTLPLGSTGSIGSSLDGDGGTPSGMYYNPHHPMLHQPSPDWSGHDNFAIGAQNSPLSQTTMGPSSAALHLSQTLNGGLTNNNNGNGVENLTNSMQNIPPSPPITVNSGCSEMSSPGITNGGNGMNGNTSPNMTNSSSNTPKPKSPYEWMNKPSYQSQPNPDDFAMACNHSGKTRTKDKYRVVYTDYQRLELEKEYHMAQYITIRRKSELAQALQLSERQVKIWFQNRRAKQRKLSKKRDDPTTPMSNGSPTVGNGLMNGSLSLQHQHMAAGIDFKPKLEPGLGHHHHHPSQIHNLHHHSMHQLSSMSMGLHNSIAGLHFTHHPSAPPPLSPPTPSSIASSIHHQHTHMS